MTSLLIRNVDAALHTPLKERGAANHRSLEEGARELLRAAVAQQATARRKHPVDVALRLFGPKHGVVLDIPPRGVAPGRAPPDFSHHADKR